jgi:proline dehydrogenase
VKLINQTIVNFVKLLPESVVFLFAKKYIAGTALSDAVNVTRELNSKGIFTTIDVLGELITKPEEAEAAKEEVLRVLEAIEENKLDANISLKPTQFGLAFDRELCFSLIEEIILRAKEYNNFIRIDMEDSSVTQKTIDMFVRLKDKYDNVGIVLQAYMRRTLDDVKKLSDLNTNFRLCKGIYIEPENIAFQDRQEVRRNFLSALDLMLTNGNYVGIATHDNYLIENAYKMLEAKGISKDKYEFQMLYGVTEHLRDKINSDGHKIRIYVPFGKHWHHYSIRRLQENPNMAWYITKSIFKLD